jgi:5-methyltetrahydrofolate--homocysteine methyltransferase
MKSFLETVRERVVIYDGAMGTQILERNLSPDDFWGKPDCTEILVLSRPDVVKDIHAAYFKAGADVVETNTFNGSSMMLGEHDLANRVHEINKRGAEIACEVAADFSVSGRPRFVAGSIGPGNKIPSLGHIGYDDMFNSYVEQTLGLITGGVDILLIETCQDILQTKIALAAAFEAMKQAGKRVPVQAQVTLQESGTMLLGTEIGAAETALEPFDCEIVGLNCATGPKEMNDAVRYLAHNAPKEISILPNAGLPENVGGVAHYRLTPQSLAEWHKKFITEYGIRIVGGCCGTNPQHIKAVADLCANLEPAKREIQVTPSASSAYSTMPLDLDPKPLIVAEEMNTTTRVEAFKNMVREGKYDDILALAKKLVAEGSHMLDLCTAIVGEDEKGYMSTILEKVATRVPAPVLVDSTEADVIEEALKRIPGKAIINSINLEDGEKRTAKVLPMAKKYGAAVIALTIDEDGMALTAEKKVAVAKRIFKLATEKYGIRPIDLIFDALTLPISTGQDDYRTAGMETLNAIKGIKQELPDVKTILGVSNISFGLNTYARRVLNSVFMKEAVDYGLDMAIVNYAKIYPLYKIPQVEVDLARKLIYYDKSAGDPLQIYMQHFTGLDKQPQVEAAPLETLSVEDKLKRCIINGEKALGDGAQKQTLEQILDDALQKYSPLEIINTVLLDGMKTVGEKIWWTLFLPTTATK